MLTDDPLSRLLIFILAIVLVASISPRITKPEVHENDDSVIAQAPHFVDHYSVLAVVDKIISCESGGDPTAKNPRSTALGICQFIDGTWEYVQEKWNIELDRNDYDDQYYACKRLYEEEGRKHWLESEPCWNK